MVFMYHSFLIHSSADGHLGCFPVLAIINSAAMNIGVHMSLSDLVSLVCMPRSGIAGSYGSSISLLPNFFKFSLCAHLFLAVRVGSFLVCTGFSLTVASGGYSLVAVSGLLILVASLVVGCWLWGVWLGSCGAQA